MGDVRVNVTVTERMIMGVSMNACESARGLCESDSYSDSLTVKMIMCVTVSINYTESE